MASLESTTKDRHHHPGKLSYRGKEYEYSGTNSSGLPTYHKICATSGSHPKRGRHPDGSAAAHSQELQGEEASSKALMLPTGSQEYSFAAPIGRSHSLSSAKRGARGKLLWHGLEPNLEGANATAGAFAMHRATEVSAVAEDSLHQCKDGQCNSTKWNTLPLCQAAGDFKARFGG
mmetsp:Transcript_10479/g.29806  ORF Transcript_10479/g.29806 Transcript_10479/m.29806 type:complete len:175 (+) Transcript_10479:216-740(+)